MSQLFGLLRGVVLTSLASSACVPAPVLRERDAQREASAVDLGSMNDDGAPQDVSAEPPPIDAPTLIDAPTPIDAPPSEDAAMDAGRDESASDVSSQNDIEDGFDAPPIFVDTSSIDAGTCESGFVVRAGSCVEVSAARLMWPMSTQTATQRRPMFRWSIGAEADGARVEVCRERACTTRVAEFLATGAQGSPTMNLPPGPLFWRVWSRSGSVEALRPSASWEVYIPWRDGAVNTAQRDTVDVNGDGYADVVLGVPERREIRVYFGSASGPRAAVTMTDPFIEPSAMALARAGDTNGDGRSDLLVRYSTSSWRVLYGRSDGYSATAFVALNPPPAPDASTYSLFMQDLGDLNGDGFTDIGGTHLPTLSPLAIYLGSGAGVARSPLMQRGLSLASATPIGDVNRDGFEDNFGFGTRLGMTTSEFVTLHGSQVTENAAISAQFPVPTSFSLQTLRARGDFNGDGRPDVLLRSFRFTEPTPVLLGSTVGFESSYGYVGSPGRRNDVVGVADYDGDGRLDVLEGNPTSASLFIYRGTVGGVTSNADTTTELPEGVLVQALSSPGDTNGEGFDDVAVLSPGTLPRQILFFWAPGSSARSDTAMRREIDRLDLLASSSRVLTID